VSANNLFVEGSMTARLVSAYGKLAANNYLQVILTPILRRVYHLSEALEVRHRSSAFGRGLARRLIVLLLFIVAAARSQSGRGGDNPQQHQESDDSRAHHS
jgi:hypothetical protein